MTIYPVPKPVPKPVKPRAFGSSLPAPTKPIKAKNAERSESEFIRTYHSEERKQWVQRQPCVICGDRPSDNAHIRGDGGSRKADYEFIIPACRKHHREMHNGIETFSTDYSIDLEATAAATELKWQAYCARSA